MTEPNDGGPAFPQTESPPGDRFIVSDDGEGYWEQQTGMTVRQWYAGQMAPAIAQVVGDELAKTVHEKTLSFEQAAAGIAEMAFKAADALIAEGEKDGA